MADRLECPTRCRWRLAGPVMVSLLVPVLVFVSDSVQALGVSTPHVMSMLNEPLRARVALLDTETLRADDIQATLAKSEQWHDMGIDRSAATDTLNLSVGGTPGQLYLDIDGGSALDRAWLDVVVSLRWPGGEITPQLTLLPATQRTMALNDIETLAEKTSGSGNNIRPSNAHPAATHQNRAARSDSVDIESETGRQDSSSAVHTMPVAGLSEADRQRLDDIGTRLMALEARLQEQQNMQAAFALTLDSIPVPPSQTDIDALRERLEALATRIDAQNAPVTASAPVETSRDISEAQAETPPDQVVSSASPALADESAFGWVYGVGVLLLLLLTAGWRIAHSWQQRRYRLLAPEDMGSPAGKSTSENGQQVNSTSEYEGGTDKGLVDHAPQGAWDAHRAQIDAICEEAAIFSQHGRGDHAAAMLQEGLSTYPGDPALLSALRDLEPSSHDGDDMRTASPHLPQDFSYPAPGPESSVVQEHDTTLHADSKAPASFHLHAPEKNYPHSWQLEEVAFDAADADNDRPDADDALRFRPYGEQTS